MDKSVLKASGLRAFRRSAPSKRSGPAPASQGHRRHSIKPERTESSRNRSGRRRCTPFPSRPIECRRARYAQKVAPVFSSSDENLPVPPPRGGAFDLRCARQRHRWRQDEEHHFRLVAFGASRTRNMGSGKGRGFNPNGRSWWRGKRSVTTGRKAKRAGERAGDLFSPTVPQERRRSAMKGSVLPAEMPLPDEFAGWDDQSCLKVWPL